MKNPYVLLATLIVLLVAAYFLGGDVVTAIFEAFTSAGAP